MKLNFKNIIDKLGLKQTEVAEKTGLSYPTINALYNGTAKSIYLDTLEKLCEVLNCTPNDVLIMDRQPQNKDDSETTTLDSTHAIPNDLRELIIKQIRLELESLMKDSSDKKSNNETK